MVVMLVFFITLAHFAGKREDENCWQEYEPTEEEFRQVIEEITGKKFKIVEKNGYLVGEPVEDEKDESEDH